MQGNAELSDLGKIIFTATVRDGSAVSACALDILGGAAGVQRLLCLFLNTLILGVGMLPQEEMWIYGASQGQHVNNQCLQSQALSKKGQMLFLPSTEQVSVLSHIYVWPSVISHPGEVFGEDHS